jgi:capsular polysaccharide biosynthesis protein
MQRSTPRAARAFGRLYALTTYPIEECFSCEIPDAYLVGDEGVVCTAEGELLVESHVHKGAMGTRVAVARAQPDLAHAPHLSGTYLSLRGFSAGNYCHWLLDLLSRLVLLDVVDPQRRVRLILPVPLKPFHLDSLRALGVAEERLTHYEGSCVRVDRVIVCRTSPELSTTYPAILFAMSEQIRRSLRAEAPRRARRRLYVSRVNAARVIVNEDELQSVLDDFGFEIVRCERLPFAEQVRLFSEASVVLGPHGAGLINHVFSPPEAKVIELYNPLFFSDNVQRIAGLHGQEHWHLYGVPVDGGIHDMSVDPAKLRRLLELACPL